MRSSAAPILRGKGRRIFQRIRTGRIKSVKSVAVLRQPMARKNTLKSIHEPVATVGSHSFVIGRQSHMEPVTGATVYRIETTRTT